MNDPTADRHGGNPESQAAGASIEPEWIRRRVRRYVETRGYIGATCDEIEHALDLRHQTASARITELKRRGDLIDTGRRRPTTSGRAAAVYVTRGNSGAAALSRLA